jgi:transposase
VKKYFPNAMIVADRFHVVRLLNHHFLKVWGMLDPEGRKSRGLLSLMRRHECKGICGAGAGKGHERRRVDPPEKASRRKRAQLAIELETTDRDLNGSKIETKTGDPNLLA